jgi:metal-dependent amidase/aminoacylase/carboxypeptidase family protein
VLFVFQQAEEGYPSGAPLVLEGLRKELGTEFTGSACYGLHLWPELPYGTVGVRAGPIMAGITSVSFQLTGQPGTIHGSRAQAGGADALAAGVSLHQQLRPLLRSRDFSDGHTAVLHIGRFEAGDRPHDTALWAELRGTLRALSADAEQLALARMQEISTEVMAAHGVACAIDVQRNIRPVVINDHAAVLRVTEACCLAGVTCEQYPPWPLGVSDDFGCYREIAPSAYFLLGCGDDRHRALLHDPHFDFDESVLLTAVEVLLTLICGDPPSNRLA